MDNAIRARRQHWFCLEALLQVHSKVSAKNKNWPHSVQIACTFGGVQQAIRYANDILGAKYLHTQLAWSLPLAINHYTFFSIHPLFFFMFWQNSVTLSLLPLKS